MSSILDEEWYSEAMSGDETVLKVDLCENAGPTNEAFFSSLARCELAALAPKMAKMLLNLHAARRKITRDYDEFDRLRDEIRKIVGDK